jgi:hypothetical protein
MVPVAIAGNISGEATTPSGNIFNEATRGVGATLYNYRNAVRVLDLFGTERQSSLLDVRQA